MDNIFLYELMTTSVKSVSKDATLDDVLALMQEHVYSCIIIVDDKKPIGIITERDLVKVLADVLVFKPQQMMTVKDIMSSPPICIHESDSLYEALVITQTRGIRHLPVINDFNHLVGLVTQTDIAHAHFTAVERHREAIEQEIRDRTQEVVEANKELKALALQDSLLGIGNRRSMEVDVHFTHANTVRYGREYACLLLDVDYFKPYNDCYGHQAGDEALKAVAKTAKESLRCSDRLYRYGGEEFLVLMPETTMFEAVQAGQRVIENIERQQIPHKKSPHGCITVSGGVGSAVNKNDWEEVVAEADKYLYDAKDFGRNQLCWNVDAAQPLVDSGEQQYISP